MALEIEDLRKPREGAMYTAPERICLTADGKLVEETHPDAVKLLVGKGCQIPASEAQKYGLIASAEPEGDGSEGYAEMAKASLIDLAEQRGMELPSRTTKQEIIDALTAADEAQEDDGAGEGN